MLKVIIHYWREKDLLKYSHGEERDISELHAIIDEIISSNLSMMLVPLENGNQVLYIGNGKKLSQS